MRIGIDQSIFKIFPSYRRGLVVARGVANRSEDPVLEDRLRKAQVAVRMAFADVDWREDVRQMAPRREVGQRVAGDSRPSPPAPQAVRKPG